MELHKKSGNPSLVVKNQHLRLDDLIQATLAFPLESKYLYKANIPLSPEPEFNVCHLRHDTTRQGLIGIKKDGGFKQPYPDRDPLVWWSLSVGPEEIKSAETRLLEKTFPGRTEEQVSEQQSFLEKFTTSPAFLRTSRLGSYRFTFPVEEVLSAYSQQVKLWPFTWPAGMTARSLKRNLNNPSFKVRLYCFVASCLKGCVEFILKVNVHGQKVKRMYTKKKKNSAL